MNNKSNKKKMKYKPNEVRSPKSKTLLKDYGGPYGYIRILLQGNKKEIKSKN
jgi:hypothetical protein